MAYAHFEDIDEVVISTKIGSQPEELADFILGSVLQSHIIETRKRKFLKSNSRSSSELNSLAYNSIEDANHHNNNLELDIHEELSPIEVHERALQILQKTIELLQKNHNSLQRGIELTHLNTPEIMKRYGSTASPRMNQRKEINKNIKN